MGHHACFPGHKMVFYFGGPCEWGTQKGCPGAGRRFRPGCCSGCRRPNNSLYVVTAASASVGMPSPGTRVATLMVDKGQMGFPREVVGSLPEAPDLLGPQVGVLLTPPGTPHHQHNEACSVCPSAKLEGRPRHVCIWRQRCLRWRNCKGPPQVLACPQSSLRVSDTGTCSHHCC